MTTTQTA